MNTLFAGVRKGDVVLAALLTALGVALMVADVTSDPDPGMRMDSRSWLMIPVFAVATLPLLWRRRSMLAVFAVTLAALTIHVLAFGWTVRCGAGLPLSIALAYSAGRLMSTRLSVVGLVASVAVQVIVLVRDSAAGLAIIGVTAAIAAGAWGAGLWLRRRSAAASEVPAATAAPVKSYV
nr:hypothetical protein [uncultured Actinoplanes sp.]